MIASRELGSANDTNLFQMEFQCENQGRGMG